MTVKKDFFPFNNFQMNKQAEQTIDETNQVNSIDNQNFYDDSSQQDISNNQVNSEETTQSWCDRSLEQLEMTISLLSQSIDSDMQDLSRQQSTLTLYQNYINEIKSQLHY